MAPINERIREGIEALAEKLGYAELLTEDETSPYVYVDLGPFSLEEFEYEQSEARVILRIHRDFPDGQNYGMVTIPVLTIDGETPAHTDRNDSKAKSLRQAGIDGDYLFWSRDWREVSVNEASDMAKATAFVHGTLANPFNN